MSLLRSANLLTPCSSLVSVTQAAMRCIPRAHIWSVSQFMNDVSIYFVSSDPRILRQSRTQETRPVATHPEDSGVHGSRLQGQAG